MGVLKGEMCLRRSKSREQNKASDLSRVFAEPRPKMKNSDLLANESTYQ